MSFAFLSCISKFPSWIIFLQPEELYFSISRTADLPATISLSCYLPENVFIVPSFKKI